MGQNDCPCFFWTSNAVAEGHHTAETLLNKYKGVDKSGKIFPFISSQKYNDAIKEIFKVCGITRAVTVLNTLTGE